MTAQPDAVDDVHISVVNTANRELLVRCLASLPAACEGLRWKATVVDNASEDGSADVVRERFPWAQLLENDVRLGFSANHNQVVGPVVAAATARYVMILNEDTELDPSCVVELVAAADADPRVGAAGPAIHGSDGEPQASAFAYPTLVGELAVALRPSLPPRPPRHRGWLNGSCILLRTEALRAVGGLDQRYFIFYEDTDICLRLHHGGWKVVLVPGAHMLHHGHQTVARPAPGHPMDRQMIRSRYLYFGKHRGRAQAEALRWLVGGAFAVRAAKAAVAGLVARDAGERSHAAVLWGLATYDPRQPLPHERPGTGAPGAGAGATGLRAPRPARCRTSGRTT